MEFIEIVNIIFENKKNYYKISDEDKIKSFFIINRKFGKGYPDIAKLFNNKYIDKASAIDMWFHFFKSEYKIPYWYWDENKNKNKNREKILNFNNLKIREDLKDNDIEFLSKYFNEELMDEMKKINKFENI